MPFLLSSANENLKPKQKEHKTERRTKNHKKVFLTTTKTDTRDFSSGTFNIFYRKIDSSSFKFCKRINPVKKSCGEIKVNETNYKADQFCI